jgi:hypothetical protein
MAAQEWGELRDALGAYHSRLNRVQTNHVNSKGLKDQSKEIAQLFFRNVRPALINYHLDEFIEPLTGAFQALLELSEGRNLTASYKRHLTAIRRLVPRVTSQIAMRAPLPGFAVSSSENDSKIIDTLSRLVPSASLSYQQAIGDLADPRRLSFRGPAHELREALREVLDHLAPDDEMSKEGVRFEKGQDDKDRTTYTMKQKVRFIFRARERSMTESAVPEKATATIDALIADMTRSTYDRGSLSAHKERGKKSIEQLKRYVDVILHDLLEI